MRMTTVISSLFQVIMFHEADMLMVRFRSSAEAIWRGGAHFRRAATAQKTELFQATAIQFPLWTWQGRQRSTRRRPARWRRRFRAGDDAKTEPFHAIAL